MGCDIHVTLGQIRPLQVPKKQQGGNALRVTGLGNQALSFSQLSFEVMDGRDPAHPDRNYDLFSWLTGIRGDLRPLVPKEPLQEATRQFLRWADTENARLEGPWGSRRSFCDDYVQGDHSFVLYPLALLCEFNYESPVALREQDEDENLADYLELEAEYAGRCYRDCFDASWFRFLTHVQQERYDFAIFSFDS